MNPSLYSLDTEVVFFPVRHHSPACARMVQMVIEHLHPAAVLIEGPSDFNAKIDELFLPHRLPIAIYSYLRLPDGKNHGAFYPFCVYSPEWQALQAARRQGAAIRLIDLPWAYMAGETKRTHRYADGALQASPYIPVLCEKLGVTNFDDLWDTLFEIDLTLSLEAFLERLHHFCYHLRATSPAINPNDLKREAYMVSCIRQAQAEFSGKILVITGGFHSSALFEQLQQPAEDIQEEPVTGATGIALTPYSYERLDNLRGYESGMPNPGFYHHVWQCPHPYPHHDLLSQAVQYLRDKGQIASTADLIAVETTAQALANLRGHQRIWRQDLIDSILGSLVKEELALGLENSFLKAIHDVFRGHERGHLAPGTTLPPLVIQIQQLLALHNLTPGQQKQVINLALPADLEKSRVAHQVRVLKIPGYWYQTTADPHIEEWHLLWSPEFEAACIEAAIYGPTLYEAAHAKLLEDIQAGLPHAAAAAQVLLDAALVGLPQAGEPFYEQLVPLIYQDGNFFTVTQALTTLLNLYRFDELLSTQHHLEIGKLLKITFQRSWWLLESLGVLQEQDKEITAAIQTILNTFERCETFLNIDRQDFMAVFTRISVDDTQMPVLRGAANGVLWVLGNMATDEILTAMRYFGDPDALGDFLFGLFALARELVQRQPLLLQAISDVILTYSDTNFMIALPALRLAFSTFTPREKHYLAETLFQETTALLPPLEVSPMQAAAVLAFEERLFNALATYGIYPHE